MGLVYLFLYFVAVDNAITLFNCFLRDFCGFRDLRVFDLVVVHRIYTCALVDYLYFLNKEKIKYKSVFTLRHNSLRLI